MSTLIAPDFRRALSKVSESNSNQIPMVNLGALIRSAQRELEANFAALFHSLNFILGEQVATFEREFAREMGAPEAVGVGSGTGALGLSLRALEITRPEQQVITSALTSPFTALAIRNSGATPVFADIDPVRLSMDPLDAEKRVTRRTAAMLPVHLHGRAWDLERLRAICRRESIALVQDACQAHGTLYQGKPLAHFSSLVAYSFYPTKNLGCLGDGGAVVTTSRRLAAKIRMLRDGGRRQDQVSRMVAMNSRLDEMQACVLRAFLPRLADWNARRERLAALYDQALGECDGIRLTPRPEGSVTHLYVIRTGRRKRLREYLAQHGIASAVHYPVPLHLHPAFTNGARNRGMLPHAERACREVLSLPLGPYLAERDVLRTAECIGRFCRLGQRTGGGRR